MAQFPVENAVGGVQDIGEIKSYMRTSVPYGYLKCDGTEYNIGDYPLLEALFIADFGSVNYFGGDGVTTWKVPDLRGEFLRGTGTNGHSGQGSGSNVGVHQNQGLPNIKGRFGHANGVGVGSGMSGAISVETVTNPTFNQNTGTNTQTYNFDASKSNSIYGASSHVTPTNTSVLYCIRAY